jgi:signal recognition particle GTPase
MSWLSKLTAALGRSRESLAGVDTLAEQRRPLDAAFWDDLEEILIAADFGVPTSEKILDGLRTVSRARSSGAGAIRRWRASSSTSGNS